MKANRIALYSRLFTTHFFVIAATNTDEMKAIST